MTADDTERDAFMRADEIAAERERTIQALSDHFAGDRISMDELEDRLGRAQRARSAAQLRQLLSDLPGSNLPVPGRASAPSPSYRSPDAQGSQNVQGSQMARGASSQVAQGAAPMPGDVRRIAEEHEVAPRGVFAAVWGGSGRKGSWIVPRHLKLFAVMGGVELDLREARLAAGVTEIECTAIMGGIEIVVPPDVRVECTGTAFMGGFEAVGGTMTYYDPAYPVIRVSGLAVMGGVEVKVRRSGERKGGKQGEKKGSRKGKREELASGDGQGA